MQEYSLEPANFSEYRDFLKDRFLQLKSKNKKFSLQNCARKANVSKALLQYLFKKKRHIGLDKFPSLARALKMTDAEEHFVYLMICQSSHKNQKIKDHFSDILSRMRHANVKTHTPTIPQAEASEKFLHQDSLSNILHAFARLDAFQEDPKWICENLAIPNISPETISALLQKLENFGFLKRDASQRLRPHGDFIYRPDPYDPNSIKLYSKIAESVAKMMKTPDAYRPSTYAQLILSVDEPGLHKIEKILLEAYNKAMAISTNCESPTAVVCIADFFMTVARIRNAP